MNRRRTDKAADWAFLGLGVCLLITVPISYLSAAGVWMLVDWVLS